jgi:hypothetical protein
MYSACTVPYGICDRQWPGGEGYKLRVEVLTQRIPACRWHQALPFLSISAAHHVTRTALVIYRCLRETERERRGV